jgi:hypothetical protein
MPVPKPKTPRPTRPTRRTGHGTTHARGATFASLTKGTNLAPISPLGGGPLPDNMRSRFSMYTPICQGWIWLALQQPQVQQVANLHNVGTGPELVVVGFFLSRGYILGRDLFFQQEKIVIDDRTRTSRRDFIVDIAINSAWGMTVYLNIDGIYFHQRNELQEFRDAVRDRNLLRFGAVVDVPDTVCYDDATLVDFLSGKGVLAA